MSAAADVVEDLVRVAVETALAAQAKEGGA